MTRSVIVTEGFDIITILRKIVTVRESMTSTEVARRFGDVLAAVKYGGESILVTKNGEPVAELRPFGEVPTCTLRSFVERWESGAADTDEAFADDLAAVNARDQPAENPWE